MGCFEFLMVAPKRLKMAAGFSSVDLVLGSERILKRNDTTIPPFVLHCDIWAEVRIGFVDFCLK